MCRNRRAANRLPRLRSPEWSGSRDGSRPSVIRGDGDEDTVRTVQRKDEPLIRRAADAAMEFTETLPSYVCTEMVTRSQSESTPANFQPIDVVSMEVLYTDGREDYRNIQINGKKTVKKIEETGGAWSTGEFGTVLVDLFSPATAADFPLPPRFARRRHHGQDVRFRSGARRFALEHPRLFADLQSGLCAVRCGSTRRRRACCASRWKPRDCPGSFPLDHVESATDYQYIRLGDAKQYLLPVHAETLSCQRGTTYCSRNVIDFRNYHKYTGESSITFGVPTGTPAKDKE